MISSSYREIKNARICGGSSIGEDPVYFERNLRRKENHIFFYDVVDNETQLIFFQLMQDIIRESMSTLYIKGGYDPIVLHINSPGGSAHCGLAIYDFIKKTGIPVTTIAEGLVASAAGVIFLAGARRVVTENSCVLLHQPSWGCDGQNRLMQDMALNVEKLFDKVIKILMKETTIAIDKTDAEERYNAVRCLCEHDYEFDCEECLMYGIATATKLEPRLTEENEKKVDEFVEKLLKEQEESEINKIKELKNPVAKKPATKKSTTKKSKEENATN